MADVELVITEEVAEIALNRPAKRNALDEAAAAALLGALDEADRARARALVLRGRGEGFCAGRDLSDAEPGAEDAEAILAGWVNPLVQRLADFPAPTFAAVHGACLGIGLGLALACDVAYVADDAKIGSPFARIGAVLDSGGHAFLVERLGAHRALELVYTGRLLSGIEAADWGLVNGSVDSGLLVDRVRGMARAVAEGPTAAFEQSKALIRRIREERLTLADVLALEAAAQGEISATHDYREGITAFQQKRPPRFLGR